MQNCKFNFDFMENLDKIKQESKKTIPPGDFNLNLIKQVRKLHFISSPRIISLSLKVLKKITSPKMAAKSNSEISLTSIWTPSNNNISKTKRINGTDFCKNIQ